ncbi:MAG: hypothetical protein CM1200mP18_09430 [Gammaproteobacteria bacterium]|nr:MAG: hypothetical protein CM1200mP18_09430 [Gammaproteobacteria bacterium]
MMDAEKLNPSEKLHAFTIQDSGGSAAAAERGEGLIRELLSDANRVEDHKARQRFDSSAGMRRFRWLFRDLCQSALGAAADLLVLNGGRLPG